MTNIIPHQMGYVMLMCECINNPCWVMNWPWLLPWDRRKSVWGCKVQNRDIVNMQAIKKSQLTWPKITLTHCPGQKYGLSPHAIQFTLYLSWCVIFPLLSFIINGKTLCTVCFMLRWWWRLYGLCVCVPVSFASAIFFQSRSEI